MKKQALLGICALFGMFLLLSDAGTVMIGAKAAIDRCIHMVIPSLFPFIFLSGIISGCLIGERMKLLSPIGALCGVPQGVESLLIVATLGGYPVGAQAVTRAYRNGSISAPTAKRLLGFCSNAGPSFIIGLLGSMFKNAAAPWLLWLIHIGSAIMVGCFLPGKAIESGKRTQQNAFSATITLLSSLKTMGVICGWVILARILLQLADKWLLSESNPVLKAILSASVELTNGCLALPLIESEPVRFVLASVMLPLGGLCIIMQTVSVTSGLGLGSYLKGKLLQMLLSFVLSTAVAAVMYQNSPEWLLPASVFGLLGSFTVYLFQKKSSNLHMLGV